MRTLPFLLLLLCGCESARLELSPDPTHRHYAGIGIGLQAEFWVGFYTCGGLGDCGSAAAADGLEVEATSGAAQLIAVDAGESRFTLQGVAAGTAEVEIATEQADGEYAIPVRPIAFSYLLPYPTGGPSALDVRSYAAQQSAAGDTYLVLAGSRLDLAQGHFSQPFTSVKPPAGTLLIGTAQLLLDPAGTSATQLDGTVELGASIGTATVTTAVGGRTDLQIVGEPEVAGLQLFDRGTAEISDSLEIRHGGTTLHVHPVDDSGHLVLSGGVAAPTVDVGDPSVVDIVIHTDDLAPRIQRTQLVAGTTTLSVAWLGQQRGVELSFVE
ncbi:MAG: hypothetical protein JRI68_04815 [Deltaproteobacteria bacterium]|nr:hypothetical protein [Deltaproteobacteria bacterium]